MFLRGNIAYNVVKRVSALIPKRIPRNYQSGPNGGKVLVISSAGLEKYFKEVANVLQIGQITWELEKEIACSYGQEFIDSLEHWGQ